MYYQIVTFLAQINNCPPGQSPKVDPITGKVSGDASCQTNLPSVSATPDSVIKIMQLALGVIAGVTLIFIVLTALKMVASQGNPQEMHKARDSIIFAAIGLVIVVFAEAIVTFVIGRL